MKKEREGCSSFSLSVLFSVFFLNPKPEPIWFRADEFEADWVVELDRVGTFITQTPQRMTWFGCFSMSFIDSIILIFQNFFSYLQQFKFLEPK